jgi:bifunctional UDP-N-acetylglucosamine pyrophosphorylase/glucosamine-1-phosphate N-acetyltransferase
MRLAVVIMAAGMGTRMKSVTPKVLHPVLGRPLLSYSILAAQQVEPAEVVIIAGHYADQVEAAVRHLHSQDNGMSLSFAVQTPQLGTGHAVQQAEQLLAGKADAVLVIPGDLPLLSGETLQALVTTFRAGASPIVMLTTEVDDPRGFGRVVRHPDGSVAAIVEEADCTPQQKNIRELNVGGYLFEAEWLWANLPRIPLSAKGEYYITDLVALAVADGQVVLANQLSSVNEAIGVNTRIHLAEATEAMRARINQKLMLAGVTLIDPATTYIDAGVRIGQDTVIYPNTYLLGSTEIGNDCRVGPNSYVIDSEIGSVCHIRFSVVESAKIEDGVDIGPFAHLRKGSHLAQGVHMGNFGEIKNSYLGPGTKMGHFSYLGDATIGENVNIGAGTITCNYDGERKHPTTIGDNAFIGSDSMLVAPLAIGPEAKTGAGSVVTHDVPAKSVVYGVPARPKPSPDH